MKKKQKMGFKEFFSPKNGYHWFGMIFAILMILTGGAIGGGLGALAGYLIIIAGRRKDYSTAKKVTLTITYTILASVIYVLITGALFTVINL